MLLNPLDISRVAFWKWKKNLPSDLCNILEEAMAGSVEGYSEDVTKRIFGGSDDFAYDVVEDGLSSS